jgi:uncharacterized protein YjbI with pentapeptide repeats
LKISAVELEELPEDFWERAQQFLLGRDGNFVAQAEQLGLDRSHDFRNSDLAGIDFSDCDLRGFDFTGSDLRRCYGIRVKLLAAETIRTKMAECLG